MLQLRLLDALGHAVIATDIGGRITHWNAPAEALYGWSADEVRGQNIVQVTPASISREQAREIMQTLTAGEPWSGTFAVRNRAGETFPVCVTDLPVSDRRNEIVGVVGVSAPLCEPSPLPVLLSGFVRGANAIWRHRVVLRAGDIPEVRVGISDPHLTQLLSLLMVREMETIDETIEVSAMMATPAILMDFGIVEKFEGVYIRLGRQSRAPAALREAAAMIRRSEFAGHLVRGARGKLFIGASSSRPMGAHLFLPLVNDQIQ